MSNAAFWISTAACFIALTNNVLLRRSKSRMRRHHKAQIREIIHAGMRMEDSAFAGVHWINRRAQDAEKKLAVANKRISALLGEDENSRLELTPEETARFLNGLKVDRNVFVTSAVALTILRDLVEADRRRKFAEKLGVPKKAKRVARLSKFCDDPVATLKRAGVPCS